MLRAIGVGSVALTMVALAYGCTPTVSGGEDEGGATRVAPGDDRLVGCGSLPVGGPTECPAQWTSELNDGLPCAMPDGTTCVYPEPGSGWLACTCGCQAANQLSCFGAFGGPNCPAAMPADGEPCPSLLGVQCPYYPDIHCSCASGTWSCSTDEETWPCLAPEQSAIPGSGLAETTPIDALSDAAVEAWCTWYVDAFPPGGQEPAPYPPEDGFAWGGASMSCGQDGCVQHVTVASCVANLRLGGCGATLGMLEDCVQTLFNQCIRVGDGCGPLLDGCGCDHTIVQADGEAGDCRMPVE